MTEHHLVPIGELVESPDTWNPARVDGDTAFTYIDLAAVDQTSKVIAAPRQVLASEAPSRARQVVEHRDVLVSTVRPNLNAVAVVPTSLDQAIASTGFCVLRPIPNRLDSSYLFHWVKTPEFVGHMVRRATGASYPAVSDRIVRSSEIPLPPLPEQRRIGAILDQADELRAKRRAALAELDSLRDSIVAQELRKFDDIEPLGGHLVFVTSGSRGWAKYYASSGSRFIRSQDVLLGSIDDSDPAYVDPPSNSESRRTAIRPGDLLITITGTVGRAASAPVELDGAFISQHVAIARPGPALRSRFAETYLCSSDGQSQLERAQYGQTKPGLNLTQIREFKLPVPDLARQDALLRKLQHVDYCRHQLGRSEHALDSLFTSLQHRAFRGEL